MKTSIGKIWENGAKSYTKWYHPFIQQFYYINTTRTIYRDSDCDSLFVVIVHCTLENRGKESLKRFLLFVRMEQQILRHEETQTGRSSPMSFCDASWDFVLHTHKTWILLQKHH